MNDQAPRRVAPGVTLDHYEILQFLGRGGIGEVFLAHDTRLGRKVAVKVLSPDVEADANRLKRFEVEARTLASLNHPNIVSVFSVEDCGGHHLLVMELVEGAGLRELIPPGGMSIAEFLAIAVDLTDGVCAAHERGVLHRDLKPENIMRTGSGRVKILDFGLAKFRAPSERSGADPTRAGSELTQDGVVMGTAPYMSPEQASGEAVDHRSDIFSLGSVFHEMLTGIQPFRGRSIGLLLTSILRDVPTPVRDSRPDLPPELDDILRRCLEKQVDGRFQSARELHLALKSLARRLEVSVSPVSGTPAAGTRQAEVHRSATRLVLDTRWGISALVAIIWGVNWIETSLETVWSTRIDANWLGYDMAKAFSWLEGGWSFERHDLAGAVAIYGGSFAYFFLPGLLLAATVAILMRRPTLDGYRIMTFALAVSYGVSLGFFLLLPVPERWAFPDSQAILLSDLWSARLIETMRPISALDNCFPSFHVSGTFDLVLVWYVLRLRGRLAVAFLGTAIAVSTLLLGIHWIADIVAGLALAIVSVRLALMINTRVAPPASAAGQVPRLATPVPAR